MSLPDGESAALLQLKGKNILIDTGGKTSGKALVSFLKSKGVTQVDTLILTNGLRGRMGGMLTLLDSLPVKEVITSHGFVYSPYYDDFDDWEYWSKVSQRLEETNIPVTDFISAKDGPQTLAGVLDGRFLNAYCSPHEPLRSSLILRVTYGKHSFLFSGDVDSLNLSYAKDFYQKVSVFSYPGGEWVAKYGHGLAEMIRPQYTVFTVNPSTEGSPSQVNLDIQKRFKLTTLRTDLHGVICFTTDGEKLNLSTGKKPASDAIYTSPWDAND